MRMEKRTYQAPDFEMERFAKDEMADAVGPSNTEGVETEIDDIPNLNQLP